MKKIVKTLLALTISVIFLKCYSQERSKNWDQENIIKVKKSDSSYIKAVKLAQDNLPRFLELINEKETNNYNFNIRASYSEDGHTEQLWFNVSKVEGNLFYAKLNNVPLHFKKIKLDDEVVIQKETIKDWIISKDHKVLEGNFAKAKL